MTCTSDLERKVAEPLFNLYDRGTFLVWRLMKIPLANDSQFAQRLEREKRLVRIRKGWQPISGSM